MCQNLPAKFLHCLPHCELVPTSSRNPALTKNIDKFRPGTNTWSSIFCLQLPWLISDYPHPSSPHVHQVTPESQSVNFPICLLVSRGKGGKAGCDHEYPRWLRCIGLGQRREDRVCAEFLVLAAWHGRSSPVAPMWHNSWWCQMAHIIALGLIGCLKDRALY